MTKVKLKYKAIFIVAFLTTLFHSSCTEKGSKSIYYPTGELSPLLTQSGDTTFYELFYKNQELKESFMEVNGVLSAEYTYYDSLGKMRQQLTYKDGELDGELLFFDESEKLIERSFAFRDEKYFMNFIQMNDTSYVLKPYLFIDNDINNLKVGDSLKFSLTVPFSSKYKLPYYEQNIDIYWSISQDSSHSSVILEDSEKYHITLNRKTSSKGESFYLEKPGVFFYNDLTTFQLKDSSFYWRVKKFIVRD